MKKVNLFLILFICFIYMETLYRLLVFNNIFISTFVNMLLFIVPLSLFLYVLSKISKSEKLNKRIFVAFLLFITIWFSVQYVVKSYFGIYVSFSTLKIADQVGDFLTKALVEITKFNLNTRYDDYKREFYNKCTDEYTEKQIRKIEEVKVWLETILKGK